MMLYIAIVVILVCIVLVSLALVRSLQPAVVAKQQSDSPAKQGGLVEINIVDPSMNDSLKNLENGGAINGS